MRHLAYLFVLAGCLAALTHVLDGDERIELVAECRDRESLMIAVEARMPDVTSQKAGLRDVAELCKRDFAARPGRDSTRVRDQLLLIASEWDLNQDRLDKQTNTCLGSVASFLR